MVKGIMVAIVVVVLAVAGYFIYDAARGMQDEVQTPTATIDIAKDQAAKSSLVAIRTAIQSYAAVNGQLPPAADQATLTAQVLRGIITMGDLTRCAES